MTAAFMTAIAVAGVVVGPVSGAVLHHFHELGGYAGWQWLFLIEGVPSVLLGLATLYCLPVSPERARWLTPQEAGRLNALLQAEREGVDDTPVRQALRGARLWILSGIYACYGMSFFGFVFWLPTIIKSSGVADPLSIGLISAIPGRGHCRDVGRRRYVDRRQNTRPVLMALSVAAAAGWAASPVADSVSASMAVLSIAMFGLMACCPCSGTCPRRLPGRFRASPSRSSRPSATRPDWSPYIVGWIKTLTSRLDVAMYMFAAASLLAVALLACLSERPAPR